MSGLIATVLLASFATGWGIQLTVSEWLRAHRK